MTRAEVLALALALRSARPAGFSGPERPGQCSPPFVGSYEPADLAWVNSVDAVAAVCLRACKGFSRREFVAACGGVK